MTDIVDFRIDQHLDDATLNGLFGRAWPTHVPRKFGTVLARSLGTVTAFIGDTLVGFVNLATDGGEHAFLLDPTVDPAFRRQGIGLELVTRAAALAGRRGCRWLHVDYESELSPFYRAAGFRESSAGVMHLVSVEIRIEDDRSLAAYTAIPIAFEVRTVLTEPALGGAAGTLSSRPVTRPYLKDYDALPFNHPRDWPTRFDLKRVLFLAAYLGPRRVGGAVTVVDPDDIARLGGADRFALLWDLRVAPDVRGIGIGRALLMAAESGARSWGLPGIAAETQDVNFAACRLYASNGYEIARIAPSAYPGLPEETLLVWAKPFV